MKKRYELDDKIREYRLKRHSGIVDLKDVKPMELKGMRYLRQMKPNIFSRETGIPMDEMIEYENPLSHEYVPEEIAEKYVVALGISYSEHQRLRALINGETDDYLTSRNIPTKVKKEVFKRDKGQCANCGDKEDLHYHHIKHFSKGGKHTEDNLKLLCKTCHVKEHKGEKVYQAMKSAFS